jgi:hypothetical protein
MGGAGEPARSAWLERPAARYWLPPAVLLLAFVPGLWLSITGARESMRGVQPSTRYSAAAGWLVQNTPAGSRLFQTDWDDFPRLFFYNTHNTYLIGLDPTYMQLYDADLYRRWVEITEGGVNDPSREIAGRFASQYVFSDLNHRSFLDQAADDPGLVEVYRDDEAVIFEVVSSGGGG